MRGDSVSEAEPAHVTTFVTMSAISGTPGTAFSRLIVSSKSRTRDLKRPQTDFAFQLRQSQPLRSDYAFCRSHSASWGHRAFCLSFRQPRNDFAAPPGTARRPCGAGNPYISRGLTPYPDWCAVACGQPRPTESKRWCCPVLPQRRRPPHAIPHASPWAYSKCSPHAIAFRTSRRSYSRSRCSRPSSLYGQQDFNSTHGFPPNGPLTGPVHRTVAPAPPPLQQEAPDRRQSTPAPRPSNATATMGPTTTGLRTLSLAQTSADPLGARASSLPATS